MYILLPNSIKRATANPHSIDTFFILVTWKETFKEAQNINKYNSSFLQ